MVGRCFSSTKHVFSCPPQNHYLFCVCVCVICCYGFYACPRDLVVFQLLKTLLCSWDTTNELEATCHARLGTTPYTITMSTSTLAGSPCFLTSKAPVTSLFTISLNMTFLSSLLNASWSMKLEFRFFQSQIKLKRFVFLRVKNDSNWRAGSIKRSSKIVVW